jgi:hypothetical protein
MESGRKPRNRDRVTSFFKRKEHTAQTPPQTASAPTSPEPSAPSIEKSKDRQRAESLYVEAAKLLSEAVKGRGGQWGAFDFPELAGEPEGFDDSQFREKINTALEAQKNTIKDRTAWENCRRTVQRLFTASSPLAKNFLTIAQQGSSVIALLCPPHMYRSRY